MKQTDIHTYSSGSWRRHIIPILVWMITATAVMGLFYRRTASFEILGIAQGEMREIAATCTGRLESVPVRLFEHVEEGQVLAVLDDKHLQAQIATISAEISRLNAELNETRNRLAAEQTNRQTDWIAQNRRFSVDVEQMRLEILELRTILETDRIVLQDLQLEVKIVQDLLDQNAVAPYELQKAQVAYKTLAKKIEQNQRLLEQSQVELKAAQQRRDEFVHRLPAHPSLENALELVRKAITVQQCLVDELKAQREELVLKSPFDGVVVANQISMRNAGGRRSGEAVFRHRGETVLAGEPILTIAADEPRQIIAYADESRVGKIRQGMAVEVIKNTQPTIIVASQVTGIGSTMELMPERLWRNPNLPQWGQPILITIHPNIKLIPGELVGIRGLEQVSTLQ